MAYITTIQKLEREKYDELKALVDDYEVVEVGSSSANEKRVDLGVSGAKVVPRLNVDGTYELTVDGRELVVVRIDKDDGWDEKLQVTVYENGDEIDAKIAEIEELAQMRVALYRQLSRTNASNGHIDQMEEELNYARQQLQTRYVSSHDSIRQSQINTYYDKQYQAYTGVLWVAILFTLVLVGVGLVYRFEMLSDRVLQPAVWVFLALAMLVFGSKLRDLARRDNMDYDTYETPGAVAKQMGNGKSSDGKQASASSVCQGAKCCADGQRYDYIRHVCAEIIEM